MAGHMWPACPYLTNPVLNHLFIYVRTIFGCENSLLLVNTSVTHSALNLEIDQSGSKAKKSGSKYIAFLKHCQQSPSKKDTETPLQKVTRITVKKVFRMLSSWSQPENHKNHETRHLQYHASLNYVIYSDCLSMHVKINALAFVCL